MGISLSLFKLQPGQNALFYWISKYFCSELATDKCCTVHVNVACWLVLTRWTSATEITPDQQLFKGINLKCASESVGLVSRKDTGLTSSPPRSHRFILRRKQEYTINQDNIYIHETHMERSTTWLNVLSWVMERSADSLSWSLWFSEGPLPTQNALNLWSTSFLCFEMLQKVRLHSVESNTKHLIKPALSLVPRAVTALPLSETCTSCFICPAL